MAKIHLKNAPSIDVEAIVRVVPNQREVIRGTWAEQVVYAKKFIGKRALKHAERDLSGVMRLADAGIATPPLLLQAETEDDGSQTQVLVFLAIENSRNAEEAWASLAGNARLNLAHQLLRAVAQHHNADLLQTDLYLKNFLVQNETIYTLDGDGIRNMLPLFKHSQAVRNLSVLLSKFDVSNLELWLKHLLHTYTLVRGWSDFSLAQVTRIKQLAAAQRKKVASHYADKKVFRNCTDVQISFENNCFLATSKQLPVRNLPRNSQDYDALIVSAQRLKSGNTCTVALAQIDGVGVVIKRYNIKSFWHGVSRALRQTRAAKSWANAHRLNILGIATAVPIALIELRKFGLKRRAYFLTEYIDAPDISEFFSQSGKTSEQAEAITNTANLFYQLYLLQISHGDMKASNIKMRNNKPVLIDLDSMQQHQFSWMALNAHARDLQRFMQNWQASPALYNAFVKAFKMVYVDHQPLRLAHIAK